MQKWVPSREIVMGKRELYAILRTPQINISTK
jgi:hypothetical protein